MIIQDAETVKRKSLDFDGCGFDKDKFTLEINYAQNRLVFTTSLDYKMVNLEEAEKVVLVDLLISLYY